MVICSLAPWKSHTTKFEVRIHMGALGTAERPEFSDLNGELKSSNFTPCLLNLPR